MGPDVENSWWIHVQQVLAFKTVVCALAEGPQTAVDLLGRGLMKSFLLPIGLTQKWAETTFPTQTIGLGLPDSQILSINKMID